MYEIFNGLAHLCMIILVFEVLFLLVVPALAIGLGGNLGLRWVRNHIPIALIRSLPGRGVRLVDRACDVVAWPVIQGAAIWHGAKVAVASLRRQVSEGH